MEAQKIAGKCEKPMPVKAFIKKFELGNWQNFRKLPLTEQIEIIKVARTVKNHAGTPAPRIVEKKDAWDSQYHAMKAVARAIADEKGKVGPAIIKLTVTLPADAYEEEREKKLLIVFEETDAIRRIAIFDANSIENKIKYVWLSPTSEAWPGSNGYDTIDGLKEDIPILEAEIAELKKNHESSEFYESQLAKTREKLGKFLLKDVLIVSSMGVFGFHSGLVWLNESIFGEDQRFGTRICGGGYLSAKKLENSEEIPADMRNSWKMFVANGKSDQYGVGPHMKAECGLHELLDRLRPEIIAVCKDLGFDELAGVFERKVKV
ncbi:MAG: hypothetical protein NTX79_00675 [Candidatus Micrarchaeota archaeon]|nr:hypothetical protein [Candidatus Micrarchaeota archaeon]